MWCRRNSSRRGVAAAIHKYESVENLRILIVRAEVANKELPKQLEELGGIVDDVACYKTVPETEDRNGAAARLIDTGAEWITFSSASTVEHFHERFNLPELRGKFPGAEGGVDRAGDEQGAGGAGDQAGRGSCHAYD